MTQQSTLEGLKVRVEYLQPRQTKDAVVSFRLPQSELEAVQELAKQYGTNLSDLVRQLLQQAVAQGMAQ